MSGLLVATLVTLSVLALCSLCVLARCCATKNDDREPAGNGGAGLVLLLSVVVLAMDVASCVQAFSAEDTNGWQLRLTVAQTFIWTLVTLSLIGQACKRHGPSCSGPSFFFFALVARIIFVLALQHPTGDASGSLWAHSAVHAYQYVALAAVSVLTLVGCCCCWAGMGAHEDMKVRREAFLAQKGGTPRMPLTEPLAAGGGAGTGAAGAGGHDPAAAAMSTVPAGCQPSQLEKFYDSFGRMQDSERLYTDAAQKLLRQEGAFNKVTSVVEFGCGTGALAEALLKNNLPETAQYVALDISATMVKLTEKRLAPWADRARVVKTDGSAQLPAIIPDHSVDRIVATYVFDALSDDFIADLLIECKRVLKPDGKICVCSLTFGATPFSSTVTDMWVAVYKVKAEWMGGCRPLELTKLLASHGWHLDFDAVVTQAALSSQVVVASPATAAVIV